MDRPRKACAATISSQCRSRCKRPTCPPDVLAVARKTFSRAQRHRQLIVVIAEAVGNVGTQVPVPTPVVEPPVVPEPTLAPVGDDLSSVKQEALTELRPLVDKLNIPAEEKFDTYLLLLRSTDDKSLIEPAHETAKLIEDESRRAQALLDIIKEIDFLSQAQK